MKHNVFKFASPVLVTAAVGGILWVSAGDLNPPPGAIQPTNRVQLNEQSITLPFTINQPGSYVLTSNLTGVAGQHGIIIQANDVTLDLNGFALIGVPGSLDGITVPATISSLAVRNGTVRDWGGDGVDTFVAVASQFENLRAIGNGVDGLRAGTGSTVTNCTAASNTRIGIVANFGSTVTNCTAGENTGIGIVANFGSTVTNCTAISNGSDGIFASDGSTITNCTARDNGGSGIATGPGSTVTNCTASGNGDDGISSLGDSTVTNCTAERNGGDGIIAAGSTVTNCTATSNTGDGIHVSSDCRVVGNTCVGNGINGDGAGIHATGSDNRIEGNNVTDNDRGIDVDLAGNIIIKNTASGHPINYDIVADNKVGVIVSAPNSGAIIGSTGGAGVGTTDPWANFSY